MSRHSIHVELVFAEELLELPEGVFIKGARVADGDLILLVESKEDLGAIELNALYGNIDEDEEQVHLGMLEPR